ncbi:MAG: PKD domain-containing protein [Bacteroidales bacterium]|nr:PKD domain-containing protein [Bacteroidales bacterium]
MKKTVFIVLALLLGMSLKAQQVKDFYSFDIKKINHIEQRTHLLYLLNNDERFVVSTSDQDGVFTIRRSKDSYTFNLADTFNDFYAEEHAIFCGMTKDEIGQSFSEWKSSLPDDFVASLMMDQYRKNRDNDLCANAFPFCTDAGLYEFPAGVNAGSGEAGPDYDCLYTTPNPAWYYMRMAQPGDMTIHMYSTPSYDIDFCCWGPFSDPVSPCPDGLTGAKKVSCSYSAQATENCHIPSTAQNGEYYILVITNYSNQVCDITFSKTAGSGTTDCSILEPFLQANTPCYGGSLRLEADSIADATYSWTSPDNQSHTGRTWNRNNATLNMSGIYSCYVVAGTQSGTESINVTVLPRVTSNFTHTAQCIAGQPVQFTGTETTTPSGHTGEITYRLWDFGDNTTSTDINPTHTYANPGSYQVSYTVRISGGNEGECPNTKTETLTVLSSMSSSIVGDAEICQNSTLTLNASVNGGSGQYNYEWKKDGVAIGGNTSSLTLLMQEPGTYHFTCKVTDGYTTQTPEFDVLVNELPVVNISGPNHVNYGQAASLSVPNTAGYQYLWTPVELIATGQGTSSVTTVGLESEQPVTISLKTTTPQGCENTGRITISLGEQFYAFVEIAGEEAVCKDNATSLVARASGGNQSYTYQWSPDNLILSGQGTDSITTKDLPSTTTFSCLVSDGTYSMSDDKTVTVWQVQDQDFTPASIACNEYYWEANNETFTEAGDYVRTFYNEHGCEYTITLHLNADNLHYTTYGNQVQTMIDTCVNDDGYFIWSPAEAVDSYLIDMEYDGYIYHDSHEFQSADGCPRIEYNWLRLFSKPSVDEELSGDTLVEAGFGYLPRIYEYIAENLSGAGTEGNYHPPVYRWELFSYYDTPNHIQGTAYESAWYCVEDPNIENKVYVYINSEGNALLRCTITTMCGIIRAEKFMWTNGYKEGFSVNEVNYDNMVNVFPNPSSGDLYIGYSESLSHNPLIISIFSYDGTLIDQISGNMDNTVTEYSMRDLTNGLYLVKIVGKDFSVIKKFVLNR